MSSVKRGIDLAVLLAAAVAVLAVLVPAMPAWSTRKTGFGASNHGFPAWLLLAITTAVFVPGIRDLVAGSTRKPA
jgi:hypothetical protein